jgi:hypothetical protein
MRKYHDQFLEGFEHGDMLLPTRLAVTSGKVKRSTLQSYRDVEFSRLVAFLILPLSARTSANDECEIFGASAYSSF